MKKIDQEIYCLLHVGHIIQSLYLLSGKILYNQISGNTESMIVRSFWNLIGVSTSVLPSAIKYKYYLI